MPRYDYRCPSCGREDELILTISESEQEVACPSCGCDMDKILKGAPGFVLKGSGWTPKGR